MTFYIGDYILSNRYKPTREFLIIKTNTNIKSENMLVTVREIDKKLYIDKIYSFINSSFEIL